MLSCEDVGDIEDCVSQETPLTSKRPTKDKVLPKALRRKTTEAEAPPTADSFIPGTQSVYIKTWGCSHNNSDGEYMAGLLATSGYSITESPLDADLWLLNSCTVKGPSEDSLKNSIRKGRELQKHIVVAGCVPQGQQDHRDLEGLSVVGVQQIDRVTEVVEETLKGHTVRLFGQKRINGKRQGGAPLDLPKIRKNPLVEIISINTGCLNHCTYCKTKHARGDLASYPPPEIVSRAQQAFGEGVVELWLTSEDLGAYGRDIGTSLPELLWQLAEVVPEGCMVRLGMTNPPYILEHLTEIAKILAHPRFYSFLHVPVQCGSDVVLKDMKRDYVVSDFKHVVDYVRKHVPGVTIATDIICGFPTETEEDFEGSLELVRDYHFPSLFINQFYPRPGTPAAHMKNRVPTQVVKERSRRMSQLFQSYHPYDHKLGETQRVLITERSHDGVHLVGHNKFYDQVLVPAEEGLMGRTVEVKITATGKHYLVGERLSHSAVGLTTRPRPAPKGAVSGSVRCGPVTECGATHGRQGSSQTKKDRRTVLTTDAFIVFVALSVGCMGLWLRYNYGAF